MKQTTEFLAEKIARMLESDAPAIELSSIRASLEKINERLDRLERASSNPQSATRNPQSIHPSQDRFAIAEAIADEIFAGLNKEKACTFEPNAKPCDHCSMCSARGF
jgi:hypothetical protein